MYRTDHEVELAKRDEPGLRSTEVPTFETLDELNRFIDTLCRRDHDYGTCVYAMSMAATAAFNYVARELGVTGFQASCADLDIVRRTRHLDGPFMLVNLADALYPQYDLIEKVRTALDDTRPWLAEQARKKLESCDGVVAPGVRTHWEQLAAYTPPPES